MHSSFVGIHRRKAEKAVYLTQKRNDTAQKFDGSRTIGSYLNTISSAQSSYCPSTQITSIHYSNSIQIDR